MQDANEKSRREILVSVRNYLHIAGFESERFSRPTDFINLQIDLALVYYNVHVLQTNRNNESINFHRQAGSGRTAVGAVCAIRKH